MNSFEIVYENDGVIVGESFKEKEEFRKIRYSKYRYIDEGDDEYIQNIVNIDIDDGDDGELEKYVWIKQKIIKNIYRIIYKYLCLDCYSVGWEMFQLAYWNKENNTLYIESTQKIDVVRKLLADGFYRSLERMFRSEPKIVSKEEFEKLGLTNFKIKKHTLPNVNAYKIENLIKSIKPNEEFGYQVLYYAINKKDLELLEKFRSKQIKFLNADIGMIHYCPKFIDIITVLAGNGKLKTIKYLIQLFIEDNKLADYVDLVFNKKNASCGLSLAIINNGYYLTLSYFLDNGLKLTGTDLDDCINKMSLSLVFQFSSKLKH